MDSPRITYAPRHDATSETELSALANAYRFILFESHTSKKGGPATVPDDTKEGSRDDFRADSILHD
jgi:hypothetical protein